MVESLKYERKYLIIEKNQNENFPASVDIHNSFSTNQRRRSHDVP